MPNRPSLCGLVACLALLAALPDAARAALTLRLDDFATAPITGTLSSTSGNAPYAARINFLREEPASAAGRLWVNDLNGKLYLLDRTTGTFTTYLDFNGNTTETPGAAGLFPGFTRANGYANGLVTFQFDPDFATLGSAHRGKFYTVHIELDTADGAAARLPSTTAVPGLTNAASYTSSAVNESLGIDGSATRHAVLVEWQDTSPGDAVFQGTAREVLRIEFTTRIHPLGDLIFNPLATSSAHADWRHLYLAVGDGGAGEQNNSTTHPTPQRLDTLQGKILRIQPDDPDGAGSLRYEVPSDNVFAADGNPTTRGEVWAYGFRNPHRLSWDAVSGNFIATDIGFHSWEEVNILHPGANYGWGEREGNRVFDVVAGTSTASVPGNDASLGYTYPVIQYGHDLATGYGDAISSGFVYRGTAIPALQGKFVFGDITTGELFYADLAALTAADDGNPATLAAFGEIDVLWNDPRDAAGLATYGRMYEIVESEYHGRGGPDTDLPGSATVSNYTGGGRADIRLALDAAGELFILSKSDGMIRALRAVPAGVAEITSQPATISVASGDSAVLRVAATGTGLAYQWRRDGVALTGETSAVLRLTNVSGASAGRYTVDVTAAGSVSITSKAATLAIVTTSDPGSVVNVSVRSRAGTGNDTLIVGFVVTGSSARTVLVRGIGPTLSGFGVADALGDPRLTLYRGADALATNDDWGGDATTAATAATIGAFPLAANSKDAALLITLPPGSYTAHVSGIGSTTGIALAEVYEVR